MSKKTGIIISREFGAGWSTWADDSSCCLDQELANKIQEYNDKLCSYGDVLKVADKNWPDYYQGGLRDATVVWVDEGTVFRIEEYDGSESLMFPQDYDWMVAK